MGIYLSEHYRWKKANECVDLIWFIDQLVNNLALLSIRKKITRNKHFKRNNLRILGLRAFTILWKRRFHHRTLEYKQFSQILRSMYQPKESCLQTKLLNNLVQKYLR